MFCVECGCELVDDAGKFCPFCGASVESANQDTTSYDNGGSDQSVENSDNPYAKDFGKNMKYISSTGSRGFVSEDEVPLYSLNNGTVAHIVSGRGWVSDDAIVTSKRLYYSCNVGLFNRTKVEEIVNLEDITGTKIVNRSPIWLIILAGILLLAGIVMISINDRSFNFACLLIGVVATVFLIIMYLIKREAFLALEYAGGLIDFKVKYYGMDKIRTFQRCIYAAKEIQKSEE